MDIGQTAVSNASINALITLNPAVVLCPGDFSYADGFYALWDTFGNLFEPLASKIPVITSGLSNYNIVICRPYYCCINNVNVFS